MKKKLLKILLLTLTLVCALTSCDFETSVATDQETTQSGAPDNQETSHIHTFDEWEITKEATCTTEGSKERYCSCGEKQTATIAQKEHTYVNGVCSVCNSNNSQNEETDSLKNKYDSACDLILSGQYTQALQMLKEIEEYDPAQEKLQNFFYAPTVIKVGSAVYPGPSYEYETLRISYDMCGNIASVNNLNTDQNYNFTYDSNGNILWGWSLDFSNIDYRGSRSYTYENGKIKKIHYENDYHRVDEYFYDTDGNISKIVTTTTYNGETESYESAKYTYTYYSDRSIQTMRVVGGYTDVKFQYDTNGNLEKIYNENKEFWILTFGEFGITEMKTIDDYIRYVYNYDAAGNITEINYYSGSDGDLTFINLFSGYQLCYSENAIAKERIGIICHTSLEDILIGFN